MLILDLVLSMTFTFFAPRLNQTLPFHVPSGQKKIAYVQNSTPVTLRISNHFSVIDKLLDQAYLLPTNNSN